MEQFIVTRADSSTYNLPGEQPRSKIVSANQKRVLMGEDVVTMEVESVGYINFQIGDWIEVFGEKYTLNTLGEPERIGENLFSYNLTFEGVKYELTKVIYRSADWTGFNPTSEFPLTGTAEDFLTVMQYNLERAFGAGAWTIGTIPTTEAKTLSFNSENCLAVLNRLCEEFGTEYVISKSGSTYVINLQEAGTVLSLQLEYGRGKGLYSLTRNNVDSKNIITRLYAEGSNRNIKVGYRANATRLQLPVNPYLDSDNQSSYGIIEGSKIFDDIFPHRTGEVASLGSDEKTFADSGMFDLNEKDVDGNTKWLIPGQSAKIHFNTGNLAGYEFEVTSYDHNTNTFKVKAYEDERGLVFPNPDTAAFQIQAGDKYVILDIIMPDSYVTAAESELQTRAQEYLNQNKQPRVEYALSLDRFYLKDTFEVGGVLPNILQPGDYIHVVDTKIGVDKNVRVKEFTRLVDDPYEYQVTLSDVIEPTRIERLITDSVEAKKALQQNRMFDPARTRRNWRDIVEVTTMLDTLRAEVALIGSPEGQFQLTSFLQPNKAGNANQFAATAGQLIHDSYENPGAWNMSAFDVTLIETSAYYLYAKCSRTTNAGLFVLSLTKIGVEDDSNYYHFPIGVLSSVNNDARTLTTTYGYTLISGNNLTTGIIQNESSGIMINLETGEVRGAFTFSNGQLVETVVNEKSERHLGGTDPAAAWTTIEIKRKHVNDIWAKTTADGIEEYFYAETTTDNFEWVLNKTKIGPGRIETGAVDADMIDVTGLFAKEINATNFNLGKGTVGDFEVDSVLRSENDQGQGIFIDPKERLITIEDKAEGAGISAVRMRGGSLTPQAQIDGAASGTYETSLISAPYDIVQNSNELRSGYSKTLYFGKASTSAGLVKPSPYEPTGSERYSLVTGKNYAADFRYLFSIVHNGGSRNGKLHKLNGSLTVTVTSKFTGVKSDGSKVTLVEARSQVIEIERDDQQAVTNHPFTRKVNFSNVSCVAAFWEVGLNLNGDLTYQQWTSELFGKYWMTSESMDIDFEVAVNKFHSFYPSLGVTELTTSGFQTIWAQNRYFRIDGDALGDSDLFIESAGPWVHSGDFILNGNKVVTAGEGAETDLSYYATKQYVQDGFLAKGAASDFANKAGDAGQDFNVKDLIIHGTVNHWLEDVITVDDASLQLNAKQDGARVNSGLIIYDNDAGIELSKLYYSNGNNWTIDGNLIVGDIGIGNLYSIKDTAITQNLGKSLVYINKGANTEGWGIRVHDNQANYRNVIESDASDNINIPKSLDIKGGLTLGSPYSGAGNGDIAMSGAIRIGTGSNYMYVGEGNISRGGTAPIELGEDVIITNNLIVRGNKIGFIDDNYDASITVNDNNTNNSGAEFHFNGDNATDNASLFFKNAYVSNDLESTQTFVSGFAGSNWKLDKADNHLTLDRLTVRGRMDVYELVINKIRATNGSLWVSDAQKIDNAAPRIDLDYYSFSLYFDDDDGNKPAIFVSGDIIKAQHFDGRNIIVVCGVIDYRSGNYYRFRTSGYSNTHVTDVDKIKGLDFVRIGNISDTNRQGAIYLTSSDSGSPYIDVLDGVNTANYSGKNKLRIGKLDGVSGQAGYGIWGSRNGNDTDFVISSDGYAKIAGWNFDDTYLYTAKYNAGSGIELRGGSTPRILTHLNSSNYISTYYSSSSSWGIYGKSNGVGVFQLGSTNQIAGWNFNDETLYKNNGDTDIKAGVIDKWSGGTIPVHGFKVDNSKHRIMMFSYNDDSYGLSGYDRVNGNHIFQLGSTNQIAGVNFDDSHLWTDNWSLEKDGTATFTKGEIAGFTIDDGTITSTDLMLASSGNISLKNNATLYFIKNNKYNWIIPGSIYYPNITDSTDGFRMVSYGQSNTNTMSHCQINIVDSSTGMNNENTIINLRGKVLTQGQRSETATSNNPDTDIFARNNVIETSYGYCDLPTSLITAKDNLGYIITGRIMTIINTGTGTCYVRNLESGNHNLPSKRAVSVILGQNYKWYVIERN